MANQGLLRRKVLLRMYRRSGGDTHRDVRIFDLAHELQMSASDLVKVAEQLEGNKLLQFSSRTIGSSYDRWCLAITSEGIREGKRMDRPFYQRFWSEYQLPLVILSTILVGLIWLFGQKVLDVVFRHFGW